MSWKVAFYGRPRNVFERALFAPGFRHCIAFAWIDVDRWLEIDPGLHRQAVKVLTGPQYARRMKALQRVGACVVKVDGRGGVKRIPRVATCAGVVAHLVGVKGALRPEGLYRALVAAEGSRSQ